SLARRKHRAWLLAVVVVAASAVLHIAKGLDLEESIANVALLVLLIRSRRWFDAPGDPASLRLLAAGGAVLAWLVVAVLLVPSGRARDPQGAPVGEPPGADGLHGHRRISRRPHGRRPRGGRAGLTGVAERLARPRFLDGDGRSRCTPAGAVRSRPRRRGTARRLPAPGPLTARLFAVLHATAAHQPQRADRVPDRRDGGLGAR